MVCAAAEDPVAAVVMHSSTADVEVVVVDGVVRKRWGRLVEGLVVGEDVRAVVGGAETVGWGDVARELAESRKALKGKCEGVDWEKAREVLMETWHIDASKVVDEV
ncbi:hypothetical protein BK809_0006914 [Diplodia seriata]|uniref:Uncharacterized protein n=1 Tax=Diplodia seriata TaxID=420778 RepID=A0A1S8B5C4_9PEZI|nr:hypothetical protein BK809_0006914 [Diplodia seriata]